MRLHSDILTLSDIYAAAREAGAYLDTAARHGSRTRAHGYEVHLRGDSKRRPNFYNGDGSYAATWDQWGVFFGALYRLDPELVCGSGKRPTYADAADYHHKTADRFTGIGLPSDAHGDHVFRFDGIPYESRCTSCSARRVWTP